MSKLRAYLEHQGDRIVAVCAAHRVPVNCTGGTVGPRHIRFFISPAPHVRFANIKRLADDLAVALRVPTLEITHSTEGIAIEIANPDPFSVRLRPLLNAIAEGGPCPQSTALFGMTDDGTPLLARLAAPDVAHVLVAGTTGSGKSMLLRAIAASLAFWHRADLLKLLILDPSGQTFRAFGGLPHLARPPISAPGEMLEALRSLVFLMEQRDRRGESLPRIIVIVDELADLVMQVAGAEELLTRLVQRARKSGIHLVAATQRPSAAILSGLMRANFPLRLVGKVVSADDAKIAAGRGGTNAQNLVGRGDFICVSGTESRHFQAPYVTDEDIQTLLNTRLLDLHVERARVDTPILEGHANVLPPVAVEDADAEELPRVQDAIDRLRPKWSEIQAGLEQGRISKSALVRSLWGKDKTYAGSFKRWLDSALESLATSTSTSTTSSTTYFASDVKGIAA